MKALSVYTTRHAADRSWKHHTAGERPGISHQFQDKTTEATSAEDIVTKAEVVEKPRRRSRPNGEKTTSTGDGEKKTSETIV